MHHSRLGVAVIDCQTTDLTEAVAFWSGVLGTPGVLDEDGKYAVFEGQRGPRVLVQAVDHEPRVHLDIEADDKEAEVRRLQALGAREIARIKGWIVMEAPTGHRFCVVGPQGDDFPGDAARWED
jgi:predicted enzyme related to lactoylglutathione lyase